MAAVSPPAITLERVSRRFGAVQAVQDVSLEVATGDRRAILGPNGAGKTTLFNLVCGDFAPTRGKVVLFGEDITHLPAHQRTRVGIGRTYQNSLLLDGLSVRDNLYLAVRGARAGRFSLLRSRKGDVHRAAAREVAERVRLDHLLDRKARELSHGQRRQLEVGMALAGKPRLLMLDEPGAGLSPAERPELLRLLQELPRSLSLVLIEHDMDIALPVADRVTVMKDGEVAVESTPDVVSDHPVVRAIYLGGGARGGH